MATHPSILAWRIPWTEEPGGLHFGEGGCRRAGHDIVTKNNNNKGTQQRMQENNLAGEIST